MSNERRYRVQNITTGRVYDIGGDIALQIGNAGWPANDKSPIPKWIALRCTPNFPDHLASHKNGDLLFESTGALDENNELIYEQIFVI